MADNLISVSVADDDGDTRSVPVFFENTVTPANMQTYFTAFAPLLDAVIGGKIVEASYTAQLTLPGGLKAAPNANIEVQKGAQFSFSNPSRYKWGLYVPTMLPTAFSGDLVNLEFQGMGDFVDAYVAGLATFSPTNGYGFDLTALARAKKTFRK